MAKLYETITKFANDHVSNRNEIIHVYLGNYNPWGGSCYISKKTYESLLDFIIKNKNNINKIMKDYMYKNTIYTHNVINKMYFLKDSEKYSIEYSKNLIIAKKYIVNKVVIESTNFDNFPHINKYDSIVEQQHTVYNLNKYMKLHFVEENSSKYFVYFEIFPTNQYDNNDFINHDTITKFIDLLDKLLLIN